MSYIRVRDSRAIYHYLVRAHEGEHHMTHKLTVESPARSCNYLSDANYTFFL